MGPHCPRIVKTPSTQPLLNNTPNKPLTELQDSSNVSATVSSELLGSTIHAAHDSTTAVPGFESASDLFRGDSGSNVLAVQPTGPNVSGSTTDSDMVQDPAREKDIEMDTTHQNAYTQHDDGNPPVAQPDPSNPMSTGTDQAVQLMTQLIQAQQARNLADITSQLQGPQAEQVMLVLQLAKAAATPTGAGRGNPPAQPDTATDTDPNSTSQSGSDSEGVTTDASEQRGRTGARRHCLAASQAQQLLEESDRDVIILEEHVETAELETIRITPQWGACVDEEEADWPNRFPCRKPFIKPWVEEVTDNWYQGEDCVDPSGIAPAARRTILPAADGTLALRQDAVMPGASRGCTKYQMNDLKRRLAYEKGERVEDRLTPISLAELIRRDQRQKDLFAEDMFWQDEIRSSLYVPGPEDAPVNFAYRSGLRQVMAIPYRVATPMAWVYPYAHGQLQESLTDQLMTASL